VDLVDLRGIVQRAQESPLNADEVRKLLGAVDTLAFLTQELERKGTSVERLRRMLFGSSSEKSRDILGTPTPPADPDAPASTTAAGPAKPPAAPAEPRERAKNHSASTSSIFTRAERARLRASSRYGPVKSTPVTTQPARANSTAWRPGPQQRSRTRVPLFASASIRICAASSTASSSRSLGKMADWIPTHRFSSSHQSIRTSAQ